MKPGKVITFYSYKGGTGRTMALANVACLLTERENCERGVLMIDWDLEAPGLHRFFFQSKNQAIDVDSYKFERLPGLIDFWEKVNNSALSPKSHSQKDPEVQARALIKKINIRKYIQRVDLSALYGKRSFGKLFLLKAGCFDEQYPSRVSRFPWEDLHERSPWIYKLFADELSELFDYILVDSRTGITDTSGICTMIMPEKLVVVFTPNTQSLTGIPDLVRRALNYRLASDDLRSLMIYPLPSRIENTEPTQKEAWRFGTKEGDILGYQPRFESLLKDSYGLDEISLDLYFNNVQLQHIPAYSYGEKIAVLLEKRDDRQSLANSYEIFTNWLIDVDSPWNVTANLSTSSVVLGSGAIAQGGEAVAAGKGGVAIHGDVHADGNIILGDLYQIKENYDKARSRYLRRLQAYCQSLPLLALGSDESDEQEITLNDVYIELDTTAQSNQSDGDQSKSTVLSVLDAAVNTKRMVLLGDPGSGKSTFLKSFVARLASAILSEDVPIKDIPVELIPVLITLRDLVTQIGQLNLDIMSSEKQQEALLSAVRNQIIGQLAYFGATDFTAPLTDALESGRVLLALDGLDELPQQYRGYVRRIILALIRQYEIERIIVTCRTRSYIGDLIIPGFKTFTIAPFSDEKIQQFVRAWYQVQASWGRISEEQLINRSEDLVKAANSKGIIELCRTPVSLTSLAIIHQKEVSLPRERVRLYSLMVDILLRRWQKHKMGDGVFTEALKDDLRLRSAIERLAFEIQQRGKKDVRATSLSRNEILSLLESSTYFGTLTAASEFLDYIDQRAGLIIGVGSDSDRPSNYQFIHRTLQEYLAGVYLGSQRDLTRIIYELAAEDNYWDSVVQLAFEELFYNRRGINILLDLAYQLCPTQEPKDQRIWRTLFWSAQISALVGKSAIEDDTGRPEGGRIYLDRLLPYLVLSLSSELLPQERNENGQVLAHLGDPRSEVLTVGDLEFIYIPDGPFLMGRNENRDPNVTEDEQPQHHLELPAFGISRYPITNAQFFEFINDGGYDEPRFWSETDYKSIMQKGKRNIPESFDLSNFPKVDITWYEAMAFCRWLTEQLQKNRTPKISSAINKSFLEEFSSSHVIATLPSEAEWEKAACGPSVRLYPWGDDFDSNKANSQETGIGTTNVVGCFPGGASQYGVQELSGNVWEWTRSVFKPYPYNTKDGREIYHNNGERVVRGGSFLSHSEICRCSFRKEVLPSYNSTDIGFRIVIVKNINE